MHSRKWRCQVPPWGVVAGPPLTFSVQIPGLSCGGGKHFHGTLRLHSHSVWHTGTHFFLPVLRVVSRCSPSTRKYTFFFVRDPVACAQLISTPGPLHRLFSLPGTPFPSPWLASPCSGLSSGDVSSERPSNVLGHIALLGFPEIFCLCTLIAHVPSNS